MSEAPIRIRLQRDAPVTLSVWIALGPTMPADFQMRRACADWLDRHVDEPFRASLKEWCDPERLELTVQPVGALPAPPLDVLRRAGTQPDEERRLAAATHELVVKAQDPATGGAAGRLAFWAVTAAARALASAYHGVILDRDLPRLLPIDSYDRPVAPGIRVPDYVCVVMPPSGEGDVATLGMRKFQLPEILAQTVPADLKRPLGHVLLALAQILVHRARKALNTSTAMAPVLAVPAEFVLDLRHEAIARWQLDLGVQSNSLLAAPVRIEHAADGPLRLLPPRSFAGTHVAWLRQLRRELLGEAVAAPPPRAAAAPADGPAPTMTMEEAHQKALAEFPDLKARWKRGLPRGHQLFVKRGFPTPQGVPEYLWIAVSGWFEGKIRGTLANEPRMRDDLHLGMHLQLQEEDVYDWLVKLPDGSEAGGWTTRASST